MAPAFRWIYQATGDPAAHTTPLPLAHQGLTATWLLCAALPWATCLRPPRGEGCMCGWAPLKGSAPQPPLQACLT